MIRIVAWILCLTALQKITATDEACDVWTEWMDDENVGDKVDPEAAGEFEIIEDLRAKYQFCDNPTMIECRTATEPYEEWDKTEQTLQCHLSFGLICYNEDNAKLCMNYQVRVFCPCEVEKGAYDDSAEDELCIQDDLFKIFLSPAMTWESADDYCRDIYSVNGFDASLAVLEKRELRSTLRTFLMTSATYNHPPRNGYWIGCHDRVTEGQFTWTTGEDFSLSSTVWYKNNPNNKINLKCADEEHDQDCCQLWAFPRDNPVFKFDDDCCTRKKPFICQIHGRCAV